MAGRRRIQRNLGSLCKKWASKGKALALIGSKSNAAKKLLYVSGCRYLSDVKKKKKISKKEEEKEKLVNWISQEPRLV